MTADYDEEERFSVYQFFEDGQYERVRFLVTMVEAVEAVKHYTTSVGARMGMVKRVIITDGGDCTCFEWIYGKGQIFPTKES